MSLNPNPRENPKEINQFVQVFYSMQAHTVVSITSHINLH